MRTRDVLRKAARLIEKYGLAKGRHGSKREGFCAIGAVDAATPDGLGYSAAMTRLYRHLGHGVGIAEWNDTPGRTKEEVLQALRRAAR